MAIKHKKRGCLPWGGKRAKCTPAQRNGLFIIEREDGKSSPAAAAESSIRASSKAGVPQPSPHHGSESCKHWRITRSSRLRSGTGSSCAAGARCCRQQGFCRFLGRALRSPLGLSCLPPTLLLCLFRRSSGDPNLQLSILIACPNPQVRQICEMGTNG